MSMCALYKINVYLCGCILAKCATLYDYYNDSYDLHNFAVPAVYDITICYREGEPTIMDVVNAEPCKADIYVRRLSTSDIPVQSDQAMSDWLIKVYQEKVCYRSIVSM